MRSSPVVVLVGPTASGKTALLDAVFGSRARREAFGLPGAEVVSADSMQAYRGMDIGTAKPDADLRSRLPHLLVDILDISQQYTVGDFVHLADEACEKVSARGELPILCGGAGFYVRNFICGLPSAPPAEPATRKGVASDLSELGAAALRAELARSDPGSAARIHDRDIYRLTRALEIVRTTGRPLADFAASTAPRPGRRFLVLGIAPAPGELAARIEARVDAMMAAGLADEIAGLRASGHGPEDPGMKAIGYREFFAAEKEHTVAAMIKRDSRQYAKRQMTFFRKLPGIEWIDPEPAAFASRVSAIVQAAGSEL